MEYFNMAIVLTFFGITTAHAQPVLVKEISPNSEDFTVAGSAMTFRPPGIQH